MRTRLTALLFAATALTLVAPSTVGATTADTTLTDVVIAVRGPIPDGGGMTAARLAKLRAAIRVAGTRPRRDAARDVHQHHARILGAHHRRSSVARLQA